MCVCVSEYDETVIHQVFIICEMIRCTKGGLTPPCAKLPKVIFLGFSSFHFQHYETGGEVRARGQLRVPDLSVKLHLYSSFFRVFFVCLFSGHISLRMLDVLFIV